MYYSKLLIPTLREAPNDAEVVSHKLMVRAGYIRKVASGIYTLLPLCFMVIKRIENIIREEMIASGAQELLLPIVMPSELWKETGRWDAYGKELLRFKDRHDRDFVVGPTHEEAITDLVRNEIRSYRELPKNLFQIQTKFRDEIRPRFGLMRGREFIMKDGYSFDRDEKESLKVYKDMFEAYKRIFKRCGLEFRPVEAATGTIGGSLSHEFQVLADSGEDEIVSCDSCEYSANVEKAEIGIKQSKDKDVGRKETKNKYKEVKTPEKKTVEEVCEFLKTDPKNIVKTLIFETDKGPIAGLVRGDYSLKEMKLKDAAGSEWCHFASEEIVNETTKGPSGFSGPIGLEIPIYADFSLLNMSDFVVGANKEGMHFTGVNLNDFKITKLVDIRRAVSGDQCPRCNGKLKEFRGIEVGQVFYLGKKYSEPMKAVYLDENGEEKTMVMGCYGIGVGRTAAAAIEQNHDEKGICWPLPIAPFMVEIIPLSIDGDVRKVADDLYEQLKFSKIDVLFDDRDARAGVKFTDADLIGIPYQIVIGAKGLAAGLIEIKERKTGNVEKIKPDEIVNYFRSIVFGS